jgi:hypothetical protein
MGVAQHLACGEKKLARRGDGGDAAAVGLVDLKE